MNLILHQFKTDLRHFRWRLLLLWLACAAGPVLNSHYALPGNGVGILGLFLNLWQACFAVAIITALIQADPLTGDTAAWLCRPLRRRHLFWAKSTFIILFVFIPWLAANCVDWALRGYSWQLTWLAVEQSLLFGGTIILVAAVLAAITPGTARFFLAMAVATGVIFGWTVVVEILVHMGVMHQVHIDSRYEDQLQRSAMAVAWLILAIGAFAAWLWQARAGRRSAAILWLAIGLLLFPVITTVWSKNFLTPRLTPSARVNLSMPGSNRPPDEAHGQWLSTEFFLTGVPAGQFAVIQDTLATAIFPGAMEPVVVPIAFRGLSRTRPASSIAGNEYYRALHDFFPSNTIWFNDSYVGGLGGVFSVQDLSKQLQHHPPTAMLDGHLTLDLYTIKKVAEMPLDYASVVAFPGLRVTLQKVSLIDGVIALTLDESFARIAFNRNVDNDYGDNSDTFCTFVLYHPGSGEAFVVNQRNTREYVPTLGNLESHSVVNLSFPYPALRERLAGISAADWLRQARLCVFAPVYAGTSDLSFHQDNYNWSDNYGAVVSWQNEQFADVQAIDHASLPANFTESQLEAYLDQILLNLPQSWASKTCDTACKKLAAIGTNGLPALLNRLPLGWNTENMVIFPMVTKLITRAQLPALRAALQRDDHVVDIFTSKGWEADARDILVTRLADHRQAMTSSAVRVAAEARDPASYADLRWQFVHMDYGHDQVIKALEQCPGFDVTGAVRDAWQNVRLGVTDGHGLAFLAARQNLPDALNQAIVNAQSTPDEDDRQRQLSQLASLTGYNGPTDNILSWLAANIRRLQYDPTQQRYMLGARP